MPRYVYRCEPCKKIFEADLKLKFADIKVKCPRCKKGMKKLLMPVRFKVK